MKIVHVVECFAGGTFNFISALTNKLNTEQHIIIYGIDRDNTPHDFKEIFPDGTIFYEWKNAKRNINPIKDLKALIELCKILRRIKDIDVIHLHSSKAGFLGRIAAFLLRKTDKVLYTTHAISFLRLDVSLKKRKVFVLMEKIGSLFGGQIIACSKSEMEAIKAKGIKNVIYINNGIEPIMLKASKKKLGKFTVISIGRLSIQKNPRLFNEIAERFIDYKDIEFIWCGDGELRHELTSPNIRVTGWIDKDEIIDNLSKADLYLSTSLWEGLPLSVLEAMSIGLPLILSNCIGNVDLKIDSNYIYSQAKEAEKKINLLYLKSNLLKQKGIESRKIFLESFTLNKMSKKYLYLYRKINV